MFTRNRELAIGSAEEGEQQDSLCDVFDYYDVVTRRNRVDTILQEAITRGNRRKKGNIHHLIVHPTFSSHPDLLEGAQEKGVSEFVDEWQHSFLSQIQDVITANRRNSTLVMPANEQVPRQYKLNKLARRTLVSEDGTEGRYPAGFLPPRALHELLAKTKGLHPEDQYVVHGSAWNHCPSQLAIQLHCLTRFGVYFPYTFTGGYLSLRMPPAKNFFRLMGLLSNLQLLEGSPASLGVQHNSYLISSLEKQNGAKNTEQLMREATIVIPDPTEVEARQTEQAA